MNRKFFSLSIIYKVQIVSKEFWGINLNINYSKHSFIGIFIQGPLLRLQIEAYLDDHPDFLDSYVPRKVKRTTIEKWLIQNTHTVAFSRIQGAKH